MNREKKEQYISPVPLLHQISIKPQKWDESVRFIRHPRGRDEVEMVVYSIKLLELNPFTYKVEEPHNDKREVNKLLEEVHKPQSS